VGWGLDIYVCRIGLGYRGHEEVPMKEIERLLDAGFGI
jgi:hypothetical protein